MKSYERREKVAKAIQKELGSLIQKGSVKDDRLDKFVSIVDVNLNSSLSSARVVYSVLSDNEDELARMSTQAALNESAGHLRGVVGRRLNLKYAPKLIFVASDSLSKSVDMVHLIDKTVEEDESKHEINDD